MSVEKYQSSYDINGNRLKKMINVVPEAFEDGEINWEILKECLGNFIDDSTVGIEHYSFTWPGKREARRLAGKPPQGALVPAVGEGIDEEKTKNIFIEGDNLEALKLLQKDYAEKIKMIYIDPPYNTGNDYIYSDNYKQPLDEYLKLAGQIDEESNPMVSNKKTDGRFHSKWLSMMYPRLILARNLLTDDGMMFISIDDNEVNNLRKLGNEVFGEENLIQEIVWKRHAGGGNDSRYFAVDHEYILCWAKIKESINRLRIPLSDKDKAEYKHRDKYFESLGPYKTRSFYRMRKDDPRSGLQYDIQCPDGEKIFGEWKWGEESFKKAYEEEKVFIRKDRNGKWAVEYKIYLYGKDGEERAKVPRSLILDKVRNSRGKSTLTEILGKANVFNNPKPIELIAHLINLGMSEGDIFLDFFGGACSSIHGLLNLNQVRGNRMFICVQMPEQLDFEKKEQKVGHEYCESIGKPTNIAEIGKERIRRVIQKIKSEDSSDILAGKDLGFKVFKLKKSHLKENFSLTLIQEQLL